MTNKRSLFNEATRVQMPALVHLTRIGYTYFGKISEDMSGSVFDPDTNILIRIFKEQFAKLNPDHAGEAEAMLRTIRQELDNDDIGESFYKRLKAISPVRLIDFEHPENNTYHCTAEFTCKRDEDEFRPDITLFVNGLPLVFIEVKKPNNIGGMVAEAERMNKQRFPNKKFRRFINITQLMLFSNNMEYDAMGGIVPIQGVFYGKTLRQFDYVVCNPPFNLDFSGTRETLAAMPARFWAGIPNVPKKKKESMSIYTCFLQHVLNSMKPDGKAAIVLPTGFLTAKSSVEGKLLKHIVNNHLVYGVISMPSNVFANTGTNVSVVFFDNAKSSDKVILIDASKLGEEYQEGSNKKVRLTSDEIDLIVDTFINKKTVDDFSVAVSYEDIEAKKCSLAAGQYFDVKIEYVELTQEEFDSKMAELTASLQQFFDEGNVLQKEIMEQLKKVKYE